MESLRICITSCSSETYILECSPTAGQCYGFRAVHAKMAWGSAIDHYVEFASPHRVVREAVYSSVLDIVLQDIGCSEMMMV